MDIKPSWHEFLRQVYILSRELEKQKDEIHEACGLSSPQKEVLTMLKQNMLTISDLARLRYVSRQSAQVTVKELLEEGLVDERENPRHKRSHLIVITEKGLERHRKAREKEDLIIEEKFKGIEPSGLNEAIGLLKTINEEIQRRS